MKIPSYSFREAFSWCCSPSDAHVLLRSPRGLHCEDCGGDCGGLIPALELLPRRQFSGLLQATRSVLPQLSYGHRITPVQALVDLCICVYAAGLFVGKIASEEAQTVDELLTFPKYLGVSGLFVQFIVVYYFVSVLDKASFSGRPADILKHISYGSQTAV